MESFYLICEPLWPEDFDCGPSGQQRAVEIGRGAEGQLEVRVFPFCFHLFLALVQGQVAKIVHLPAEGPDDDLLHRHFGIADDAVTVVEPERRIEVFGIGELFVRELQRHDAVERQREEIAARLRELDETIPALVEQPHEERVQHHRRSVGLGPVAAIIDADADSFLHRVDEFVEILPVRGNVFQQDAVIYALALRKDAVHGKRGKHPVLDRVLLQHLLVENVVPESVLPVALDDDSEHVQDRVPVPVESAAGDADALGHLRPEPSAVDLLERQPSGLVDGVHQPDIFLEEGVCFHVVKNVKL